MAKPRICHQCSAEFRRSRGQGLRCFDCFVTAQLATTKAGHAVRRAVAKGAIKDLRADHVGCADCGARATCYDHRDYARPTDVVAVCHRCNLRRGPAAPLSVEVLRALRPTLEYNRQRVAITLARTLQDAA